MRYFFLIIVFSYSFFAQSLPKEFSSKFNAILSDSFFNSTILALDVYDLTDQKNIISLNEKLLLRPASNMKLFTTSAALIYFPVNYNFETKFYFDGEITDSTLIGNIIVEGGYDPSYTTDDIDSVVNAVKRNGINKINGKLIADTNQDDSLYWGRGWMWDDNPNGFQPYLSSVSINENNLEVIYRPSNIGEIAEVRLNPQSNYFSLENSLITTSEDTSNVIIERDWLNKSNKILVRGDISYRRRLDTNKVNVLEPEFYFLSLLAKKLNENDIEVTSEPDTGSVQNSSKLFYQHYTPLLTVLKETNAESNNLYAENILLALAKEYFKPSYSTEKGLKLIDSLIIKIGQNPENYVFADGSGLSFYNLISAGLIVDLLKYMYYEEPTLYIHLVNSLAVAGKTGTLKNRINYGTTYNNVKAKTGTISGVSTLSGYLTTAKNHLFAFSILIQNYSSKPNKARRVQDKLCQLLIEHF